MPPNILVSAGEASGDMYASELAAAIREIHPDAQFFGCAGPKMQAVGIRPVVDSASLSVVGLMEVVAHVPRIYGEFKKMVTAARTEQPDVAVLTDSPDFNLRLARKLRRFGVPVVYYIAPQVWAWRESRVKQMRRDLDRVLCIFPFEEDWFRQRGVNAEYIGHPLTKLVRPSLGRAEFFRKHNLDHRQPVLALLPGSRNGEVRRHLPLLVEAVERLRSTLTVSPVLALPLKFTERAGSEFFRERIHGSTIKMIEGETWDVLAYADVAIAASGTVTVEAALLGTPMVTFYRVTPVSWLLGRWLVRVPYYSMVNLVAQRKIVPELMQGEATGERLAAEAANLLENSREREFMKSEIETVAARLATDGDPTRRAARIVCSYLEKK